MPEDHEKKDDLSGDLKEFGRFVLLIAIVGGIVLGIIVGVAAYVTQPVVTPDQYQIVPYL